MAKHEVQWVKLSGGRVLPALKLICPTCNTLDLGVDVRTDVTPFIARCGKGHEWEVNPETDA